MPTSLKLLRRREVEQLTGLSRSQIYILIQRNRFPRQIHVTARSVAWVHLEIEQWIEERVRSRDASNKNVRKTL
jgi:prophage regulatory protein